MYGQSPCAGDPFPHWADVSCAPVVCQALEMTETASANKSSRCHSAAKWVLSGRMLLSLKLAASEQPAFCWKEKALPYSHSES